MKGLLVFCRGGWGLEGEKGERRFFQLFFFKIAFSLFPLFLLLLSSYFCCYFSSFFPPFTCVWCFRINSGGHTWLVLLAERNGGRFLLLLYKYLRRRGRNGVGGGEERAKIEALSGHATGHVFSSLALSPSYCNAFAPVCME